MSVYCHVYSEETSKAGVVRSGVKRTEQTSFLKLVVGRKKKGGKGEDVDKNHRSSSCFILQKWIGLWIPLISSIGCFIKLHIFVRKHWESGKTNWNQGGERTRGSHLVLMTLLHFH